MAYKRLTVTLPPDVLEKLERIAKKQSRSLSNTLRYLVEQFKE